MAKPKKSVWLVVIWEMTESGVPFASIRRVTSSLRLAEAEVKSHVIAGLAAPWAWYEVEERFVDGNDSDPRVVRVYSHKGRKRRHHPKNLLSHLKRALKSSDFRMPP